MKTLIGFILAFGFLLLFTVLANAQTLVVRHGSHGRLVHKKTVVVKPSHARVVVTRPTAPNVTVVKSRRPGKNYFWIEPHWQWSSARDGYVWVDGHWEKYRTGYRYSPGKWVTAHGGGFTWQAGIWIKL